MNAALEAINQSKQLRSLLLFLGLIGAGWVVASWILNGSAGHRYGYHCREHPKELAGGLLSFYSLGAV
jgi:hypothetical protein